MPRYWPHGPFLCVTETASAAPASRGAPNRAAVPVIPARIRILQLTTRLGAEMFSGQMGPMRSVLQRARPDLSQTVQARRLSRPRSPQAEKRAYLGRGIHLTPTGNTLYSY